MEKLIDAYLAKVGADIPDFDDIVHDQMMRALSPGVNARCFRCDGAGTDDGEWSNGRNTCGLCNGCGRVVVNDTPERRALTVPPCELEAFYYAQTRMPEQRMAA